MACSTLVRVGVRVRVRGMVGVRVRVRVAPPSHVDSRHEHGSVLGRLEVGRALTLDHLASQG